MRPVSEDIPDVASWVVPHSVGPRYLYFMIIYFVLSFVHILVAYSLNEPLVQYFSLIHFKVKKTVYDMGRNVLDPINNLLEYIGIILGIELYVMLFFL